MFSYRLQLVLCLGINCTIGYGTLQYSFSLLSLEIESHFSWSSTFIYGVYSLGILLGGLAAPLLGKALDRYGTHRLMALGSFVVAYSLYGLSGISSKVEYVIYLLLLEVVSILVLYESAFVALVQAKLRSKNNKADLTRLSITQITLMAGFASTIFWPLVAYLLSVTDWRSVYVFMALLHLMVCFPLHFFIIKKPNNKESDAEHFIDNDIGNAEELASGDLSIDPSHKEMLIPKQRVIEILVALSFGVVAFSINGLHIHLFTLMDSLGVAETIAVLAGSLIGPFQVVSRILDMLLARQITPILLGIISIFCMLGGIVLLLMTSFINGYVALWFAIFFGLGQGLTYIVRGAIPLQIFGNKNYGAVTGRINSVRMIMTAIAPVTFSILMTALGAEAVLSLMVLCMITSLCVLAYLRTEMLRRLPSSGNVS